MPLHSLSIQLRIVGEQERKNRKVSKRKEDIVSHYKMASRCVRFVQKLSIIQDEYRVFGGLVLV